jgi:hypothetical protein
MFIVILLIILTLSCNQSTQSNQKLQSEIDSLQLKQANAYKPGLGEFMSEIQIHHAKLWFAGQAQNWPLADFEIHEIMEALDNIKNYDSDRPEVAQIQMLDPALDSLNIAIQQKDPVLFKTSFVLLTNTCNNCHRATKHGFNIIKIPDTSPYTNQDFKMH